MNIEVAVYKGETILAIGTIREVATKLRLKPYNIYYYLMPAYQRRIAKRSCERRVGRKVVVRV